MKKINRLLITSSLALFTCNSLAADFSKYKEIIPANEDGLLGSYSASDVNITTGKCTDCVTLPQARWYFEKEWIAIPKKGVPIAGFSMTANAQDDIPKDLDKKSLPPLIWLGSSKVVKSAKLTTDGLMKMSDGNSMSFATTSKISTNLSYWNDDTDKFFSQRDVRLRGDFTDYFFVARTVWPLDFNIPLSSIVKPLNENESLKSLVQFENGGAKSAYESRLLWAKNEATTKLVAGKTVIGFMLNGAQGDDDEAHGGHFAVVTGKMEADGNYSRWLVNNFYNLASNSEKGIIAGATPMDKYLMDLNNGQSYYRPSYMLVAVLKNDRVASQYQSAINRVYNHFYRNDFVYDHSRDNCAGVSIDTLRTLGWNIPTRGVESQLKATAAYFYVGMSEMSLTKGRAIYDYLNTETTRLFPAVAFDAIGQDLLQWTRQLHLDHTPQTPFTKQLSDDVEAVYFVRIPQIPSSRVFGIAPVYGFDQYMQQAPADRTKWKIVPTTPNPFPESLKDGAALKLEKPSLVPLPVAMVLLLLIGGFAWLMRKLLRRRG